MSHRAVVAVQNGDDTFDLHHSPNGAYDLYLTDRLADRVAGSDEGIEALAGDTGLDVPVTDMVRDGARSGPPGADVGLPKLGRPDVLPEPFAAGVLIDGVGQLVDFQAIEALYLVRDGHVETYLPVWVEHDVIRPWREHLTVEVYRPRKYPIDPVEFHRELDRTDPERVIDGDALYPSSCWTDDGVVLEVVGRCHESVYSTHRGVVNWFAEADDRSAEAGSQRGLVGVVRTPEYCLRIFGPRDGHLHRSPEGRGIFLRLSNNDTDGHAALVEDANLARLAAGRQLNAAEPGTATDKQDALKGILVDLLADHLESAATFSPAPFGGFVRELSADID